MDSARIGMGSIVVVLYISLTFYAHVVQWNLLNEYPEGDTKLVLISRSTQYHG